MFGFYGRILTVDLSRNESRVESLPDEVFAGCLGGKGLATRLLLEKIPSVWIRWRRKT